MNRYPSSHLQGTLPNSQHDRTMTHNLQYFNWMEYQTYLDQQDHFQPETTLHLGVQAGGDRPLRQGQGLWQGQLLLQVGRLGAALCQCCVSVRVDVMSV